MAAGAWERVVARALVTLWVAGLIAALAVTWSERADVKHPGAVQLQVAILVVASAWLIHALLADPARLRRGSTVIVAVAAATVAVGLHGWVFGGAFTFRFSPAVSLWALASVLAAGAGWGAVAGVAAGAFVTTARLLGVWAPDQWPATLNTILVRAQTPSPWAASFAALLGSATAGWLAAQLVGWLRAAENEVSTRRAREELARHLHETVLQTLAAVRYATTDPRVVALIADADVELRRFVSGERLASSGLADTITSQVDVFRRRFALSPTAAISADLPDYHPSVVDAVGSAVGEALTNAGKHAGAGVVHVAVTHHSAGVLVSVRDDGRGFDPDAVARRGLAHAITEPMTRVGGRVDVASHMGEGTEVRLWLP